MLGLRNMQIRKLGSQIGYNYYQFLILHESSKPNRKPVNRHRLTGNRFLQYRNLTGETGTDRPVNRKDPFVSSNRTGLTEPPVKETGNQPNLTGTFLTFEQR